MPARPCREARERRGLTLREAALLLHVRSTYLERIEAGYQKLPFGLSERMATIYGCAQMHLHVNPKRPE